MKKLSPLLIALQFLTRIPLPAWLSVDWNKKNTGLSQIYYPVIGLLLGTMLFGVYLLLLQGIDNHLLISSVLVLVWVMLTGALHIDGLADSMDAWVGGHGDSKKTLAIMRDPQAGPIAVVAVMMVLLIKVTALSTVLAGSAMVIIFVPALARMIVPYFFLLTPYLRSDGLGKAISEHRHPVLVSMLAIACLLPFVIGFKALALDVLAAWLVFNLLLRQMIMRRFGGLTGDIAGMVVELNEAALLVMLVFFL